MFSAADGLARDGRSAAQSGFTILMLFRLDNRRSAAATCKLLGSLVLDVRY